MTATTATLAAPAAKRRPWYLTLWIQVLVAMVVGILLGHFAPQTGTAMQPLRHVTCTQHPVHNLAGVAIDVWVACPHPPEARDLNRWFAFTTTMRFLDDTGTRWERKVTAHLDSGKDDVAGEEV